MLTPLRLEAPAKINLSLAVVGRRADGYHELVTEMALLELADRLLLMPGCSGLRVERQETAGAVPVVPGENLAWRGVVAGFGAEPAAWCLTLEKLVPAAAGMGGGSSDAAAGWRLARRASGAGDVATAWDLARLAGLGADVPFFAAGAAAARLTGIGEHVEPIQAPSGFVVLVHPAFELATRAVFAELGRGEWSARPEPERNDLLPAAVRLRPEIEALMRAVAAAGLAPRMTGSGPTVYGITDDLERAHGAMARLERAGLRARVTRFRARAASIEVASDEIEED